MIEQDTVRLLRECDAGVKMGISSIEDVLDHVQADKLRKRLTNCKAEHRKLEKEIRSQLDRFHDDGKAPNPVAKSMSWMKTGMNGETYGTKKERRIDFKVDARLGKVRRVCKGVASV